MSEPDQSVTVSISQMSHAEGLDLPSYETGLSAGMDLRAAVDGDEPVIIPPGDRSLIPTGLRIALPEGYEAQVRPRSGLALKRGVTVLNTPGTIDADYRGEIGVLLINLGQDVFEVQRGDRVAQMVIAPHADVTWEKKLVLDETSRGEGGFGHTGKS